MGKNAIESLAPSRTLQRGKSLWSWLRGAILARRSPDALASALVVILALSIALHLQVIATTTGASYDIQSYSIQAAALLQHQNVYDVTTRYPYPPVWIWIVALMRLLATATHLPFDAVVKLPAMLGDLALIPLLYAYARISVGPRIPALLPAILFGLNPLTLVISAGHGQFDSLTLLFVLLALYLRVAAGDDTRRNLWSAVALGVAIALKGYPVLFAPYLILTMAPRYWLRGAVAVLAPLVGSLALYTLLFGYSAHMLPLILGYQSTYDVGWGYLLLRFDPTLAPTTLAQLATFAKVFLIAFAAVVPTLFFRKAPAAAVTLIFAAFLATTVGMSMQYTLWILPFLCLVAPWWVVPYTLAALGAVAPLYTRDFPGALPTGAIWRALLEPLSAHRVIGVMSLIFVAALLDCFLLADAAKRASHIMKKL